MHTAGGVGPRVGFIMSVKAPGTRQGSEAQDLGDPEGHDQAKPDHSCLGAKQCFEVFPVQAI